MIQNLLIGNGVIIQYGGAEYLNSSLVNRALKNIRTNQFPAHLYPEECADFVVTMQKQHRRALRGKYDKYAFTSYDRSSLESFKRRYSTARSYSVDEIGFEDYFLLFELIHNKQGIGNPERFTSRGVMKRMFLDSVYNKGELENVHFNFPLHFVEWLKEFDQIFTTNYDSNLDAALGKDVFHLHGSFATLSETYDPTSFRNQLQDDLLDGEQVDPRFMYLYSNCLVSYVGDLKLSSMGQSPQANKAMKGFVAGYESDPSIRKQIDELPDGNDLTRRLKEAIRLKAKQPELEHGEQYPHSRLEQTTGPLAIVGLSPTNDGHLFIQILANDRISEVEYYYFDEREIAEAESLFHSKTLRVIDVRSLWAKFEKP
jgi:hypothetical protein